MENRFVSFLRSNYKDLMLWYNFGLDRDSFIDHYTPETNTYVYPTKDIIEDLEDPTYEFSECTFCKLDDVKEIQMRDLRRIGNKLYWVSKVSTNIYEDKEEFFSFLCCYNFTDSVKSLLSYVNGQSRVLFKDDDLYGYDYESDEPVLEERSLLPLIKRDGVYVVQYKFDHEDHAFIFLKYGDRITVVNYYNDRLYVVQLSYYEVIGILWLAEQNDRDNRLLLTKLFGVVELAVESDYHIISLVDCEYWKRAANTSNYKDYLRDVIKPLFVGRDEEHLSVSLDKLENIC